MDSLFEYVLMFCRDVSYLFHRYDLFSPELHQIKVSRYAHTFTWSLFND